jgi:hypothetical protein
MKSTIVVGNGVSVLEKENGATIDSFENVIRFNYFQIDGFEKNVGTKTDVWLFNNYSLKERDVADQPINAKQRIEKYKSHVKDDVWFILKSYNSAKDKMLKSIFPKCTVKPMPSAKLPKSLMRATLGIIFLYHFIDRFKNLTITGFDLLNDDSTHYYDDSLLHDPRGLTAMKDCHNFAKERVWLKSMIDQGKVQVI